MTAKARICCKVIVPVNVWDSACVPSVLDFGASSTTGVTVMRVTNLSLAIGLTVLLAACSREQPEGAPRAPDTSSPSLAEKTTPADPAHEAVAQIAPTQGNTVTGSLALSPSAAGVHISGAVQGLKPDAEF